MSSSRSPSTRHGFRRGSTPIPIEPSRSRGNIRLYSPADITRLRQIQRLISDLGVNLAGVEVIIRMNRRLQEAEVELQRLREELEYCRANHRR